MQSGFDPYGKHFPSHQQPPHHEPCDSSHQCDFDFSESRTTIPNTGGALAVESDRVKWKCPPSFAASDYLEDPLLKAAYEEPEVLRKPPETWPPSKPARVRCSKAEFLKLARRWDSLGACSLIDADTKDFDEAVGLFCVPKDAELDRLIVNPQVINSRMHSLSSATKELAPGCLLIMLHLAPEDNFRFSADDLSDYYYTFRVSPDRARRNAFRMILSSDDVRDFSCFHNQLEGRPILICLNTLAMGDNLAVEIAQASHASVLRTLVGSMRAHEVLRYRWPVPRGDFVELLAIDDHVGIQRVPRNLPIDSLPLRDTVVFDEATNAYKQVGLVLHEKKKKRNRSQGIILGADFDGCAGRVMAPRHRIIILCMISLALAHKGTCTPKLLSMVVGCWVHVLLFRRVLFAVVDNLFKEGRGLPANQVFCLSRESRNELTLLAALGPTAQSDLRVKHDEHIYASDASPQWGAVCKAPVSANMTAELWRHSEQRGFYTRLQSPAATVLSELGLSAESDEQFAHAAFKDPPVSGTPKFPNGHHLFTSDRNPDVPSSLSEGILYDCCEIFRGSGNWSNVHSARGLNCH